METFGTEKANRAAEAFVERTADSYKVVLDHMIGLQDRNVQYVRGLFEGFASEVRHQVNANRVITRELVERAEEQRDTLRAVVEEPLHAYWNLAFTPLSYYKEGIEQAERVTPVSDINTGLPIANYDELNVGEISQKIDNLSVEDLRKVRAYEKGHKNRDTLVEQIDRKIKAAS